MDRLSAIGSAPAGMPAHWWHMQPGERARKPRRRLSFLLLPVSAPPNRCGWPVSWPGSPARPLGHISYEDCYRLSAREQGCSQRPTPVGALAQAVGVQPSCWLRGHIPSAVQLLSPYGLTNNLVLIPALDEAKHMTRRNIS